MTPERKLKNSGVSRKYDDYATFYAPCFIIVSEVVRNIGNFRNI